MSEPDGAAAGGDAAPVETNVPDDVEVDTEAVERLRTDR